MKNQALFSSKDKSKKLKCRLLQLLFSALRVNFYWTTILINCSPIIEKLPNIGNHMNAVLLNVYYRIV